MWSVTVPATGRCIVPTAQSQGIIARGLSVPSAGGNRPAKPPPKLAALATWVPRRQRRYFWMVLSYISLVKTAATGTALLKANGRLILARVLSTEIEANVRQVQAWPATGK